MQNQVLHDKSDNSQAYDMWSTLQGLQEVKLLMDGVHSLLLSNKQLAYLNA